MNSLKSNFLLKVSTFMVLMACFWVLSGTLLGGKNLRAILTQWGDEAQMTVYLKSSDVKVKEEIEGRLRQHQVVDEVRFVSAEMALKDFQKDMKSYAPEALQSEELVELIPSSLEVRLKSSVPVTERYIELNQLAEIVKTYEGVEDVSFGQDWLEKFSGIVNFAERSLEALIIILSLASIFVISNVIRASIYSKKEEIVVLEMFGATPSMIRRPFVIEGTVISFIASLTAMFFCYLIYKLWMNGLEEQLAYLKLQETFGFFGIPSVIAIIILQTILGLLVSYLCVRAINDGHAGKSEAT